MKRFLKKRWHHLPLGIITAVLVVCLITSGAFAAYNFFTATAEITVEEALGVEFTPDDANASWDPNTNTITFSNIQVGETTGWMFWITNSASVDIPVTVTWTQTGGPSSVLGPGGPYPIPCAHSWIGCEWNVDAFGNFNPRTAIVPAGAVGGWGQPPGTPQCAIGIGFHAGHSTAPGTYTFTLTIER